MWETVKIGDVCEFAYGKPLPYAERLSEAGVPAYGANGVKTYAKNALYEKPSIVVGRKGSVGELNRVDEPFWALDVAYYVKIDERTLDIDFLYYFLSLQNLPALARGVKPGINRNEVYDISLRLPPLAEQQRIVAKLDAAFAQIDTAVTSADARESEIGNLWSVLLANELSNDSDTIAWETVRIGDACAISNGGTPDSKDPAYWGDEIQWLTPKDMGKLETRYVSATARQITSAGLANSSAKLVPESSVILSCRAPIGHVAINAVPMSFNQGCKGLTPGEKITPQFLYYFLFSSKTLLNGLGTGTTFKEISARVLSNVEIPVPPLAEQRRIVAKLDAALAHIDTAKQAIGRSKVIYRALKSAILTQALQCEVT